MHLEALPYEVVNDIFKYIKRENRYVHLFVSKKWHSSVKPILYQEVTLVNEILGLLLQQLFSKDNNVEPFQSFAATNKLSVQDR
jgi:hypothetical protein